MKDPLSQLKDIHLPDPVSWWPLAPGWWILICLFLIMIALAIYLYIRSQRKTRQELIIEQSLQIFHDLEDQSIEPKVLVSELSKLLRRTAISLYGRDNTAKLAGKEWLNFLNLHGETKAFTEGVGQAFGDQPYRPHVDYNRTALLGLTNHWLQQQLKRDSQKSNDKQGDDNA